MENVVKSDRCEPDTPAPQQEEQEYCEGTFRMEKCCDRLKTSTFVVNIGPRQLDDLVNFLQNTVGAYEANGYLIMAHHLTDAGAGWVLGLTIGWYE